MHTEIETDTATDNETISSAVNGNKSNEETVQWELNRSYGYKTIEHTLRKQAWWRTVRSAFELCTFSRRPAQKPSFRNEFRPVNIAAGR